MTRLFTIFVALLLAGVAQASGGGQGLPHEAAANVNLDDQASLQRGARLFMNYCVSCHSIKYMRYSRIAQDLGLTEQQVMENLNFTGAKFGETIVVSMTPAQGQTWFGAAPPDLSLSARVRGPDWIYNYLRSFYVDPSRPSGWNNTVFPNASMPNVLWALQGSQRAVFDVDHVTKEPVVTKLELAAPGQVNTVAFDTAARDITAFMVYVGEPAALKRKKIGMWVVLFLAGFTFLAWLLKHEYWRDVH
jgi:ubiquinol-cytochrome c reductase cytochrome c1 subunit